MATITVYKPITGRVRVRLPYDYNNRRWLRGSIGRYIKPEWDPKRKSWLIAREHFDALVKALVKEFHEVEVYTDHRSDERCTTACQNAMGTDCVCSCGGRYHNGGAPVEGWTEIGHVLVGNTIREQWTVDDLFNF